MVLEMLLSNLDCSSDTCEDGQLAIKKLKESDPSLCAPGTHLFLPLSPRCPQVVVARNMHINACTLLHHVVFVHHSLGAAHGTGTRSS